VSASYVPALQISLNFGFIVFSLAVGEGLEPSNSDSKSSIMLASWWSTPYYFSIS
jgi:hypothetical protein